MAALDTAQTVFQPTPGAAPLGIDAFDKQASFLSSLASQQSQFAGQLWNNASSAFNNAYDIYSKDAERRAAEDAPALIKHDGDNNVIPPSSFYPPGISTKAYAETYRNTALALYRTSAEQELANHSDLLKQQFPSDPDAYNAGMEKKRQAMQVSLDPTQRGWVDLRGAQIQSQGATQIQVRNQSDANALHSAAAAEKYAGIVDDATRLAAFQAAARSNQTPEQLNDTITNSAALGQRWQDQVALWQAAGQSPAFIEDQRRKLGQNVLIKYGQENIKHSYKDFYDPTTGYPNPAKIADARLTIEADAKAFGQKYPGHEKEYSDAMESALQFATGQSSLRAQQVQIDDKKRMLPQQREMQSDAAEAQRLKFSNEPDALARSQAITEKLEQRGRDYLKNTQISDSVAMELAGTAFQTGAISRAAFDQGNTNRLVGLNATVKDPSIPFEQKAAAYENSVAIRNNPEVYRNLNPGQRSYLQGTMDDYVKQNYGMQVQAFNAKILEGTTSPQKIDEVRADQVAKNMISPEQIVATGQIDAAAKKAYRDKQTQSTLAGQLVENAQAGKTSTAEQIAAHKAETNWRPPGNAPAVDFANPAHVAAVEQHYQKFGYLPDLAQSALNSMTLSPDENAIAGQKHLLKTIDQVERDKIDKVTGNRNYDPRNEEAIEANVAATVGKNYTFLHNASLFGADNAFKVAMQVGPEPSKAGSLGQTPDQTRGSLTQSVGNLETLLQKNTASNTLSAIVRDPASLWRGDADATPEQKAIASAQGLGNKGVLDTVRNLIPGIGGTSSYEKVEIDPNLAKSLIENGTVNLAVNGKAIHAGQPNGSPENFAVNTAFFEAARAGKLGSTVSADGKTLRIGWQTLGNQVEQSMGVHMTPAMEQGYAAGLVEAENFRVNGTLEEVDRSRVHTLPYQTSGGQQRFLISVQDQNGGFTQRLDIAKDDPRIAVQTMATVKAATQYIIANSEGGISPDTYGKAVAGVAGGWLGPLAALSDTTGIPMKYPAEGYVHLGSLIGNAIQNMQIGINRPGATEAILGDQRMLSDAQVAMRKNTVVQTVKMLQELDASMKKIPDAPNLSQTLTHMMEEHLPGVDSSALRQLIKDAGFYQPGRQKPVQTGPSRIGTESP